VFEPQPFRIAAEHDSARSTANRSPCTTRRLARLVANFNATTLRLKPDGNTVLIVRMSRCRG